MQSDETKPPQKLRKLRIAWSVFWGVACVLLIVLWVRSYQWEESASGPLPGASGFILDSIPSRLEIQLWDGHLSWEVIRYSQESLKARHIERSPFRGTGFGFYSRPHYCIIHIPYWFLSISTAILTAVPWLRYSKRFRLRTLLIATTLVAVVLGLAVWAGRKWLTE